MAGLNRLSVGGEPALPFIDLTEKHSGAGCVLVFSAAGLSGFYLARLITLFQATLAQRNPSIC